MPRLTAAQLAYGVLTVVVATTIGIVATGAESLPVLLGLVLPALAMGAAVSFGVRRTQQGSPVRTADPIVRVPQAPAAVRRERVHSLSR